MFAELPRLLERAGPGEDKGPDNTGFITALFTVLVEGDDTNEPVADAVRGILDGHVMLDRRIAESGRYPPVDILRSLSRAAQGCLTSGGNGMGPPGSRHTGTAGRDGRSGAHGRYRAGADPAVDEGGRGQARRSRRCCTRIVSSKPHWMARSSGCVTFSGQGDAAMSEANLRALTALHRLRRVETDAARRDLGEAFAWEADLAERHVAMRLEYETACRMTGDFDRDVFAAWLGRMRPEWAGMAEALRDAEARTLAARAALAHRRVAATAFLEETLCKGHHRARFDPGAARSGHAGGCGAHVEASCRRSRNPSAAYGDPACVNAASGRIVPG